MQCNVMGAAEDWIKISISISNNEQLFLVALLLYLLNYNLSTYYSAWEIGFPLFGTSTMEQVPYC